MILRAGPGLSIEALDRHPSQQLAIWPNSEKKSRIDTVLRHADGELEIRTGTPGPIDLPPGLRKRVLGYVTVHKGATRITAADIEVAEQ